MDELSKAILLLVNFKNQAAKKHLNLVSTQGNQPAYSESCEQMVEILLSQYAIKKNNNPNNNNQDKKGDKGRKDDNTKSEEKDDNVEGTTGMHVGEVTSIPSGF